jgi:hypothetical protein
MSASRASTGGADPSAVPVEAVPVEAVPVEAVPVEAVPVEAVPLEAVPLEAVARWRRNRAAKVVLPLPPFPTKAIFTTSTDIRFH